VQTQQADTRARAERPDRDSATALATDTTTVTGSGNPIVYQTIRQGNPIVLGPQSQPTVLGKTPALGAGTYLVHFDVHLVMGPNDNVVCAAWFSNLPFGNDGVFALAGNGATNSGRGPNGVYATATADDTITVTNGQAIGLTCNVGHFGQGIYAGEWSLAATKIGTLHKETIQ
jgi:hypothetical protein